VKRKITRRKETYKLNQKLAVLKTAISQRKSLQSKQS